MDVRRPLPLILIALVAIALPVSADVCPDTPLAVLASTSEQRCVRICQDSDYECCATVCRGKPEEELPSTRFLSRGDLDFEWPEIPDLTKEQRETVLRSTLEVLHSLGMLGSLESQEVGDLARLLAKATGSEDGE